jgi:eukaryotic-like serine/threonine-protein kinase
MPELVPNTNLSHYRIVSKIGAGGMGEVYLAEDTRLRRKVALKTLPAEFASNRDRMRRFEQEAQAAAALNQPNIAHIYEIGEHDGTNFIVMEFIDGLTLRERMRQTPMKLGEVLDVAVQIASALSAAHAGGIIHRDIKPENIMLRRDAIVKVLDFGLAKLTERVPPNLVDTEAPTRAVIKTESGVVMGTAIYMSPEQARGLQVDARTDIFSLGVLVYEMVAGRLPFEGSNTNEILASILSDNEPQPLARFSREVPAELERIVSKALRKDREERYQTARDLLIDLKTLKDEQTFEDKLKRSGQPESASLAPVATAGGATVATVDQPIVWSDELATDRATSSAEYIVTEIKRHKLAAISALAVLALGVTGLIAYLRARNTEVAIESLAVLPFVNASGNSDVEYLSDGMTETLINSLSQLPHLSVKARSSVFRYKGKDVDTQQVASQLSVQAILNGRFVLHGDDLTLYLSLVDARNGNQVWGEQYGRKLQDLVALQKEIARDVSQKLRARLSSADEQRLAKNYTENTEAYQLYLKGRYHLLKLTPPEIQTSISYFQQALDIDPSYALAYVGLADAYRSFALVGEMAAGDFFPKAKRAAQKALEIDDALAEAHAELGFTIFWYDWDWNAAENQLERALVLNPNNADTHLFYAHLLSNTGRHAEGLAEVKRARELDPLELRINGLEAQFLVHAGKPDEALARLQKILELNPNSWFPHMFASSAYIEKGMFAEAIAEARKASELNSFNSQPTAQLGYALAKSGKLSEARGMLEELLKRSAEHYVSPGNIALIYNGLGDRDKTFAWLERGFEQRDAKMVFLKVEPKWNNLRDNPRFQVLMRRVGFTQ